MNNIHYITGSILLLKDEKVRNAPSASEAIHFYSVCNTNNVAVGEGGSMKSAERHSVHSSQALSAGPLTYSSSGQANRSGYFLYTRVCFLSVVDSFNSECV